MKIIQLITLILALFTSLVFAQNEEPKNHVITTIENNGSPVFQLMPKEEKLLSDAELGNAFQAIGIVAQPDQQSYGLMIYNGQPEFQTEENSLEPLTLDIAGTKVSVPFTNIKTVKRSQVKKLKVEIISVKINKAFYDYIIVSQALTISYGKMVFVVPEESFYEFQSFDSRIKGQKADRTEPAIAESSNTNTPTTSTPSSAGKTVQVRGYTRKDGTYVQPHTRSAPRKKP